MGQKPRDRINSTLELEREGLRDHLVHPPPLTDEENEAQGA